MCDSSRPGRADGLLDEPTLAWLDGVLADRPALVCFHHPPATMHQPMIDEILLTDPGGLADVLDRHPGVVAVLCGHAHTAAATTFAGRPCHVAPGVVSTLRLPAEHAVDHDYALPPAVALHVLDGTRLTTHYRVVPRPAAVGQVTPGGVTAGPDRPVLRA